MFALLTVTFLFINELENQLYLYRQRSMLQNAVDDLSQIVDSYVRQNSLFFPVL